MILLADELAVLKKMGSVMKSALWLLLGLVIGGIVGWYVRGLGEQVIRASTIFTFNDTLADKQVPYLSATGSWRGGDLANKINTVELICDASERTCDLHQADVMSLSGRPIALPVQQVVPYHEA